MPTIMDEDYVEYIPSGVSGERVLCAQCGTVIAPNAANLCIACIRNDVDITAGIPKQSTLHWCKGCERYLQPPAGQWVVAALESKELLALCLKKLKGLQSRGTEGVRLVDAGFIWTEPHSRRIKVKLTIQKEVYASTILQQVFVVEYVVCAQQCDDCTRIAAQLTWKACVQVRQKVPHKRTFFWLEQLILKHAAHRDTTNIKEAKDGIDLYYVSRSHAIKMVDFLQSVVPIRSKCSEQLISSDIHAGTANFKYTYSVEIVPLCKDDLVCLPTKVAKALGDISPITICWRVSNSIYLVDPNSLKVAELRTSTYFDTPFNSLCEAKDLQEFYVIDVQIESNPNPSVFRSAAASKFQLATVEIALSSDLSITYLTRTHLGSILKPGDHAMGYFLVNANFNNTEWEEYVDRVSRSGHRQQHLGGGIPDIILVKKSYPNARKRNKGRSWRLKNIAKEKEDDELAAMDTGAATATTSSSKKKGKSNSGQSGVDKARQELDYEIFLRDLEEDPELRGMVNLFKDPSKANKKQQSRRTHMEMDAADGAGDDNVKDDAAMLSDGDELGGEDDAEAEEDFPEIDINELLDDMEALELKDADGDVILE